MSLNSRLPEIIHEASSADTKNYVYYKVYAGSSASPTINGTTIDLTAGTLLNISVKSISATPNVWVLGSRKSVQQGETNLSKN